MSKSDSKVPTISMWHGGEYSEHTQGAKDVIDNATDLALEGLGSCNVESGDGPFAIADFGAADGGTSIDLQRQVIDAIREHAPTRPVCITYTDLPRNDFSALSVDPAERERIYEERWQLGGFPFFGSFNDIGLNMAANKTDAKDADGLAHLSALPW